MKTTKVTCDACGRDLTITTNCEDYRILLCSESIPSVSGVVTAMAEYPDFETPLHFCGFRCLGDWIRPKLESKRESKLPPSEPNP